MNILILGLGNMGSAIANALCETHTVWGIDPACTRTHLHSSVAIFSTVDEASSNIDTPIDAIILAIKPQIADSVLDTLTAYLSRDILIISSIAGLHMDTIAAQLDNKELAIARIMPTIAAKKKASMTGLSYNAFLSDAQKQLALDVAHAIGKVIEIPESLMSAITGASGSGIAFVAKFIDALTMSGVREGLGYQVSYQVALQTIRGAVALLEEQDGKAEYRNPSEFISSVCSPGGTTIEGIYKLEEHNFENAIYHAVHAARVKSDSFNKK